MRLLSIAKDGGAKSTVTGFYVIEIKRLFSIVLLVFRPGAREVYHSHAFNAMTWVLRGVLIEQRIWPNELRLPEITNYWPRLRPKITTRDNVHRVHTPLWTVALTFRGPWSKTWNEYRDEKPGRSNPLALESTTLTHGRKVVSQ
jgi:hypothetical protein